ncbi:DUF1192 domain-containing protein [Magnetospirillum sp. UT-4]|uniref:DUF1192 domain-containing protein n=1 Tax=Magnetospirillum sp. UT-4 TaxID=2681467 RepID=UPI00137DF7EB|nr:DUF1192 domain-containing protein [Magnetospirillum sp. UT-4]CAA7615080.1 conserved hypothetical protein [Magnetospirillum sp. UT-4]
MDWDDLDPKTKKPAPRVLDTMGIEELEAYIADLEAEITRVRAAIAAKRSARAGADSVFRK